MSLDPEAPEAAPASQPGPHADAQAQAQQQAREAWAAFRAGQIRRATELTMQLVRSGARPAVRPPLREIMLLEATAACLRRDRARAADLLYKLLASHPQDFLARQTFVAALLDEVRDRTAGPGAGGAPQARLGRVVYGLGTGRSGSTSLTFLFKAQPGTAFSHEHPPLLPWSGGAAEYDFHLTRMRLLSRLYDHVVDVSHWWLPRVEDIIARNARARFVVIRRDRDETVQSFLSIKGEGRPGSFNHWMRHDGSHYRRSGWDACYPKYPAQDLREALGLYWDDYYDRAARLADKYPEHVRVFPIAALQKPLGQAEILSFCGYEQPILVDDAHKNKAGVADGLSLWHNPFAPLAQPA